MQAINEYDRGIDAYTKAIETLPKDNLSQADKNIKKQCEDDIQAIKAKVAKGPPVIMRERNKMLPWDIVLQMKEEELVCVDGETPSSVSIRLVLS